VKRRTTRQRGDPKEGPNEEEKGGTERRPTRWKKREKRRQTGRETDKTKQNTVVYNRIESVCYILPLFEKPWTPRRAEGRKERKGREGEVYI
jgi:hypothetical protein